MTSAPSRDDRPDPPNAAWLGVLFVVSVGAASWVAVIWAFRWIAQAIARAVS